MEIELFKKPKNVTIIEGFPGFGLVSTIATEFLMDHLKCEKIGRIWSKEMPAMAAVHESKIIEPIGVYYNKKYNVVLVYGLNNAKGTEWEIADSLFKIYDELKAKEIIGIEGVGTLNEKNLYDILYYANFEEGKKKWEKLSARLLKEGIIIGVTGALMLKSDKQNLSCIFIETNSKLPDSKAAAKVIEYLDKYMPFDVDYAPLLDQAKKFEEKLKKIMEKGAEATQMAEDKKLTYLG